MTIKSVFQYQNICTLADISKSIAIASLSLSVLIIALHPETIIQPFARIAIVPFALVFIIVKLFNISINNLKLFGYDDEAINKMQIQKVALHPLMILWLSIVILFSISLFHIFSDVFLFHSTI